MEKSDIQKWRYSLNNLVHRLNDRVNEKVKLKRDPKTNLWYIYKDGYNAKQIPLCAISCGLKPMKAEDLSLYLTGVLDGYDAEANYSRKKKQSD